MGDREMKTYYILSLKWSENKNEYVWWESNNSGYTTDIERAGVYTAEQVESKLDYYNNGKTTRAIPVEALERLSTKRIVPTFSDNWELLEKDYLGTVK